MSESENGVEAFRWTADGGMRGLGDLPGGHFWSQANAVSADGTRVVGVGSPECSKYPYCQEAFRWTAEEGMAGLGNLNGREGAGVANAIASVSPVIVGYGIDDLQPNAVRWLPGAGPLPLIEAAPGRPTSEATDVSADGSVVVGTLREGGIQQTFRWTAEGGIVGLGCPPGSDFCSQAAVSEDGTVVVGTALVDSNPAGFRWTAEGGMVVLRDLPGGITEGGATDVSADGSRIVGSGFGPEKIRAAVLWDEQGVPRRLADLLIDHGLREELEGWTLLRATAISPDGRFVVGDGENPEGQTEAWIAGLE